MILEIGKYFTTFGLLILCFLVILRLSSNYFKTETSSLYGTFLDIVDAFMGNPRKIDYNMPEGQLFILTFAFLAQVFLMSFLIAMFVLRYFHVW